MSSFDSRPSYNAEASHFTATIKAGNLKWTAVIDWKEANKFADPLSFNALPRTTGKYAGAKVISATSEEALRAQLRQLDPSVKFIATTNKTTALGTAITTLSDSDAKMLEGMRIDPDVSDIVYHRACRQFGAPTQKRPDFRVPPTVVTKSPYSETETGELNHAFLRIFLDKTHPELKETNHEHYNTQVLLNWHQDSGLKVLTLASLGQAFEECNALEFFRKFTVRDSQSRTVAQHCAFVFVGQNPSLPSWTSRGATVHSTPARKPARSRRQCPNPETGQKPSPSTASDVE
jgi:hypothetical protein